MTEEQLNILRKALSLYKSAIEFLDDDNFKRAEYGEMLEALSNIIGEDVGYWSLYD